MAVSLRSSATTLEGPPGPPPSRFLGRHGNAICFRRDPIRYMQQAQARYGSVVRFQNDRPDLVFLFGADNLREILDNPDLFVSIGLGFPRPKGTSQARIAAGIFGVNGAEHREFRAAIAPAFAAKAVQGYFPDMVARVRGHLDQWQMTAPVDLQALMGALTVELVAVSFFGIRDLAWARRMAELLDQWLFSCTSFWTRFISSSVPGSPRRRAFRQAATIEAAIQRHLSSYRRLEDGAPPNLSSILSGACPLSHGSGIASIEGHFNILFAASHDTTTSALSWTLFLLAQHPDIARNLAEEIQTLDDPDAPTLDELQALPLLDRVIKESLRILPPVVFSSRRTSDAVTVGGYELPPGTVVTFSPFLAHHSAQTFEQPMHFKPDRWDNISPSAYEYLPFGAGRRRCIGAGFATMALKLVVAMTLARFRLTVVPGTRIDRRVRVTLRAKAGIPVILAPRDGRFSRSPVRGSINDVVAFSQS